jgi:hypothetical protein
MYRWLASVMVGTLTCVSCAAHTHAVAERSRPVLALPTDTRAALAAALHELIAALPTDSVAVCLTLPGPPPTYWYAPEPRLLAGLQATTHRVVAPDNCPQTYDLMASVMVDNSMPARPPGYIDPYDTDVWRYQLFGSDSASVVAVAHQGTLNHHYVCSARRDAGRAWRGHCEYKGRTMSAVSKRDDG